jgi:uncharacterized protein YbjT (DUF2867 family)
MILVTGATGLVGRHLITTLRGDGAEVRALSRRAVYLFSAERAGDFR